MNEWQITALLALIVILLGWLVYLAYAVLEQLNRLSLARRPSDPHGGYCHGISWMTNFSLWKYKDGRWRMVEEKCEQGFRPGDPPRRPGAYEGEVIRRPAVRNQ